MWTVVYLANNQEAKDNICALLEKNGIINRVNAIAKTQEDDQMYYNVLVPAAEVSAAHALILDEEL